jgi:hypothetical protein
MGVNAEQRARAAAVKLFADKGFHSTGSRDPARAAKTGDPGGGPRDTRLSIRMLGGRENDFSTAVGLARSVVPTVWKGTL